MEGVGASTSMLPVVWSAKLPISCQLHPTVIHHAITMDNGIILGTFRDQLQLRRDTVTYHETSDEGVFQLLGSKEVIPQVV